MRKWLAIYYANDDKFQAVSQCEVWTEDNEKLNLVTIRIWEDQLRNKFNHKKVVITNLIELEAD